MEEASSNTVTIFWNCWLTHPTGMYRAKNEKVKDAFSSSAEPLLLTAAFTEKFNFKNPTESTKLTNYCSFI
jgi:hypothetical protein